MESSNKANSGLSKIKEKVKHFFGKTLSNKKDATFDTNVKGSSYSKDSSENAKMY